MLTLARGQQVHSKSVLARLKPYLDEQGILRVGGRLENSRLSKEEKHPAVLDEHSHLAKLTIEWAHHRALHAGPGLTHMYTIRRAWIVGGLTRVKSFVRRCVICCKSFPKSTTQQMADLPKERVTAAKPFSKTGVDYAGPFQIRRSKGRGISSTKGYVAIFVCLATKAIHLEVVGDLTTESFLGALARFVSRRGRPLESVEEAWVKSMKIHLRRVTGSRKFTYEEFATLLEPGNIVIIKDPSLMKVNGKWPLGRILQVHKGADGLTRVATVKTHSSIYTRPITKLFRLPIMTTTPNQDETRQHV